VSLFVVSSLICFQRLDEPLAKTMNIKKLFFRTVVIVLEAMSISEEYLSKW
jgi:hypothetical protein